jgi:light-regulated signal transduction histidine kinase (bacteriophytochrome)
VEQLDLSVLAEKILYELVSAEPDREIQYTVNDCGPFCKAFVGDKVYAEILLTNLFSNAIKFTEEQKSARIEFGCYRDGAKGVYYVKDNGLGIDPKYIEEIFLPFRRLHLENDYPGFGIGMTIVKKIIDLHNGEIWIESELGQGTTVYFSLGKIR